MERIYTHKILLILSVFLLILFVFSSFFINSFGYTTVSDYSLPYTDLFENHISGKDDNGYYIIEGQNTVCDRCFVIESDGILYYFFVSDGYFDNSVTKYCFTDTSNYNYIYYEYSTDGTFIRQNSLLCRSSFNLWHYDFVYSTFDLVTEDGTIFFQLTPLAQVISVENLERKTTKEITEILPLILVVVVSFLGLRKALSWLSTLLRRCLILLNLLVNT